MRRVGGGEGGQREELDTYSIVLNVPQTQTHIKSTHRHGARVDLMNDQSFFYLIQYLCLKANLNFVTELQFF